MSGAGSAGGGVKGRELFPLGVERSDRRAAILSLRPRPGLRACVVAPDLEDREVGRWREAMRPGLAARQTAREARPSRRGGTA